MRTLLATAIVVLVTAPGFGFAQGGARAEQFTIAVIGKSLGNPVFLAAHKGAQDTAERLSRERGLSIQVSLLTPQEEDAELQARRVDDAVADGADAILIAPSDVDVVTPAIDRAVAAGVPVMTFDNDAPQSKRFAHYGPDDIEVGERVMEELAERLGGSGKVALLAGNPAADNLQARAEGVRRAAARHPGIELIGPFHHEERAAAAAEEVMRVDAAHPDLAGWAMIGGWPLFRSSRTLPLLSELESRELVVVSVDALPDQLLYVEKGIAVLLAQPVYEWGTVGVTTIVDAVHLGRDVPERITMELMRVTRDDLASWAATLASWGFSIDAAQYAR